ncbi:YybH family protein [Ralstonia pseudosolanacearum]|uniref:YybH family protein n=1 Tax=Ralstonia pseudosolanacearum TaxID=1310165 RepID=UPI003863FC8E
MRHFIFAVTVASTLAVPGVTFGQTSQKIESATSSDERAIHAIHQRWAGLIQAKNASAIEKLYADDAVLLAPSERAVSGRAAIGARWARQLALDGLKFDLHPQQLLISASGDLAHERGTYDFAAKLPQGSITDTGKYVLGWRKVGGEWKVISDIFNSDPAPAAK